jgi:hypothetical protein
MLQQAAYYSAKPAVLAQELQELGLAEDKVCKSLGILAAEVFLSRVSCVYKRTVSLFS